MTRTCIVAGATGFIGRNLVAGLARAGCRVVAVSGSGRPVEGAAQALPIAALDAMAVPADSVLFHVAAHPYDACRFRDQQPEILRVNARLAADLYAFCATRGIREVRVASSSAVYDSAASILDDSYPIDLNSAPHAGESGYAWSKRWTELLGRLYAESHGINTLAFRLSNPYGPCDTVDLDKAHVAPAFVMRALSSDPVFEIRGNAEAERDFIYVGDVVDVFVRSLEWSGRTDVFNLCRGETVSLRTLAETAMRVAHVSKPIVVGAAGGGVLVRRLTADRIRDAFGIERFTPLEDGLRHTAAWYRHALALL